MQKLARPLQGLSRSNVVSELLAGVTLLAIAVPLNIGYAQIAGLPPTAGLYALVVPTIVYALTVSSRQMVASPDAAAAALVASSIGGLAIAGSADYATLAIAQAILSGLMFLALAVFRLGFLANFLSKPILHGFVGGLALNILTSQVAKMLGVPIDSGAEFAEKFVELAERIGETNLIALLMSVLSVAVLVLGRKLSTAVPWALIVLVIATVATVSLNLERYGIDVLGEVPAGPPSLTWPVIEWSTWLILVPSALALTLISTAEGLLVSRSYGEKRGYEISPNRDLFALGLGNIAAGASGSFAVGGSVSRTAAMDQVGSRTQLPSIVTAVGTLLLLLFGTALLADIPSPAIGAIVGVAVVRLLGIAEFAQLWKTDRFEWGIATACFIVTLFIGSIIGILVAFMLALINLARRVANPAIDVLRTDGTPGSERLEEAPMGSVSVPGVIVIRLAAPLFFANATVFKTAVQQAVVRAREAGNGPVLHLVLDMEAVTDIDVTGAESFEALRDWLQNEQIELSFSRVRADTLARLKQMRILGDERCFDTNREAVDTLGPTPQQKEMP